LKTAHQLTSEDALTALAKSSGIETWEELSNFVKKIPYGRNSNREDFSLVISKKKGSCSSKHAFLKKVADLNGIENVKLMLGIYKMDQANTPAIGNLLVENALGYIPEAHCYLKIENKGFDFTHLNSDFKTIEKDLLHELEITPEQVSVFKVDYHKKFLKNWIGENNISKVFIEIWRLREKCIENLIKKL